MGGPDNILPLEGAARALARPHAAAPPLSAAEGSELVVACDPFHACAEELRALRTQLVIRWDNAGVKARRLAIVSPGAQEGRSYLAANLAVAFAQLGQRTLLVDADLRAPRQHALFGLDAASGLAALLAGRAGREVLRALPDFGPLSVLPAGAPPPNPQELLSRPALGALLGELQAQLAARPVRLHHAEDDLSAGHGGVAPIEHERAQRARGEHRVLAAGRHRLALGLATESRVGVCRPGVGGGARRLGRRGLGRGRGSRSGSLVGARGLRLVDRLAQLALAAGLHRTADDVGRPARAARHGLRQHHAGRREDGDHRERASHGSASARRRASSPSSSALGLSPASGSAGASAPARRCAHFLQNTASGSFC
jgi:hypothetical protein